MNTFTFTKSPIAIDRLEAEIRGSAITASLQDISLDGLDGLTLTFRAQLTSDDITLLNAVVAAHTGDPLYRSEPRILDHSHVDANGRIRMSVAPDVHASTHANGASDEINVTGLSGVLADQQHIVPSEAVSAMGAKSNSNPLNHDRFQQSEISNLPETQLSLSYPTHSNQNDPTVQEKAALDAAAAPGATNPLLTKSAGDAVYPQLAHVHLPAQVTGFDKAAQDAVGNAALDTNSVDLSYNSTTGQLQAALKTQTTSTVALSEDVNGVKADLDSNLKTHYDTAYSHSSRTDNPHATTKSQVGLTNVDNTADLDKPVSTATQTALNTKVSSSLVGVANGVASLDSTGKVPSTQLPSYVDDVIEAASFSALPSTGESGKIYITLDDNLEYRWGGTVYVQVAQSLALGETASTAYRGDRGKTAYDHSLVITGNPHGTTRTDLALGNVDNTSDLNKPISTATQTALNTKEPTVTVGNTAQYYRGDKAWTTLDKTSVGLPNVDNTSDLSKPISTATQTTLNTKEPTLASGTTAQYYRGDKTWQALNKAAAGLANVDNTSDLNKPVSTATQTALSAKEATVAAGTTAQYYRGDKTWQTLNKAAVGLSNVDNTSDVNKPVSTATQTALDAKVSSSLLGVANGLASLDSTGKVPSTQLPSYVDDVIEAANYAALPATGESGKIYITLDDNLEYRWGGTVYVQVAQSLALGETSATAYRGDRGKIAYDHSQLVTGNPHGTTKTDLSLGNIDNTSDLSKPISTATQTALNAKEATVSSGSTAQYYRGDKTWQTLDKTSVGLPNVDNTSDVNKPVSTATQTALNTKEATVTPGTTAQYYRGDKAWTTLDKTAVGLGNLDNTSDLSKPISTATQTALNTKEPTLSSGTTAQYYRGDKTWQTHDKASVGLANVDNTSDVNKPISTATQTALNTKESTLSAGTTSQYYRGDKSWQTLDKTSVGLANLDNTSDLNKPVSTATQTALNAKINTSLIGVAGGIAPLDGTGKIASNYLPSYVDDVIEAATYSSLPATGETGKIYITLDSNLEYRWGGSVYVQIAQSLALGETSATAYRGDRGKIAYDHSQLVTGNPHGTTKTDLILGNVDNTSDVNKPISTATQTALNTKEPTIAAGTLTQYYRGDKSWQALTPTVVSLGNVTNDAQLKIVSNLSDLNNVTTARTNLGLGTAATRNVGTSSGTVSDGAHTHSWTQVSKTGAKLSDLDVPAYPIGSGLQYFLVEQDASLWWMQLPTTLALQNGVVVAAPVYAYNFVNCIVSDDGGNQVTVTPDVTAMRKRSTTLTFSASGNTTATFLFWTASTVATSTSSYIPSYTSKVREIVVTSVTAGSTGQVDRLSCYSRARANTSTIVTTDTLVFSAQNTDSGVAFNDSYGRQWKIDLTNQNITLSDLNKYGFYYQRVSGSNNLNNVVVQIELDEV